MTDLKSIRDNVITLIQQKSPDLRLKEGTDITKAVLNAVNSYSQIKPYMTITDYDGDGATFAFALPDGFVEGDNISHVDWVRYPAGEYQDPDAELVERNLWTVDHTATATYKVHLKSLIPTTGNTLRIRAGIPHTVDASSSTIYAADEQAVEYMAAEVCCLFMVAQSARSTSPIIASDAVNYRTKAQEWTALAKEFRTKWEKDLQVVSGTRAGFATADRDWRYPSGRGALTHPESWR